MIDARTVRAKALAILAAVVAACALAGAILRAIGRKGQ